MTTPTTVRPKPSTDWATAMQMPDHHDGPAGDAFLTWAKNHGLQPNVQEHAGQRRLTLTGSSGLTRPLRVETYRTQVDGTLVHLASGTAEQHTAHEYRWRVVHTSNGEIMAAGEGYIDRRDRDHAVATLWPGLDIVEVDE